jgi:hypothetical protein
MTFGIRKCTQDALRQFRRLKGTRINGQPGFIVYVSGRPLAAMIFHIHDGCIRTIYAVGNPDKLQTLPEPEQSRT